MENKYIEEKNKEKIYEYIDKNIKSGKIKRLSKSAPEFSRFYCTYSSYTIESPFVMIFENTINMHELGYETSFIILGEKDNINNLKKILKLKSERKSIKK